jgi:hypothetical protein
MISEHDLFLQAAHDLRSPLTALKVLLIQDSPDRELLRLVVERIENITHELLSSARSMRQAQEQRDQASATA